MLFISARDQRKDQRVCCNHSAGGYRDYDRMDPLDHPHALVYYLRSQDSQSFMQGQAQFLQLKQQWQLASLSA